MANRRTQNKSLLRKMIPHAAVLALTISLVATITYRSYADLQKETQANQELNQKIEQMNESNLRLQEEIHYMKNDSKKIENEAKKYGLRPQEKTVSKPADR